MEVRVEPESVLEWVESVLMGVESVLSVVELALAESRLESPGAGG